MAAETVETPSLRTFVIASMRLAGVAVDEETLARVLPLVQTALADGPRLTCEAAGTLEPLPHPGGPGGGG